MNQMNMNQFNLMNNFQDAAAQGAEPVKVLLTGPSGSGKTSSIAYGAPKPLWAIDMERSGFSQLAKEVDGIKVYKTSNPQEVLALTQQLLAFKRSGQQLPFKSIALESGTVLYNKIKSYWKKQWGKTKLEPTEYETPKDEFYEIIENLKELDVHLFVTAHASDNYLKGTFMKIDAVNPIKADCDKRLIHELDVHYILSEKSKGVYTAQLKKNRLKDSKGNSLLPDVIDNFDNRSLVNMIIEMSQKDEGFAKEKVGQTNVIKTDGELAKMIDDIVDLVNNQLGISGERAVEIMQEATNSKIANPTELTKDQARLVINRLRLLMEEMNSSGDE
ncbi:Sak4-like ssDNA annealing protein [Bacillus phage Slash]|uniref:Uncharacterized protein n=3 Tax=Slashvirus TaxID=1921709 RepID=U5Q0G6_9CAUD|nr:Sak4-like ssDNA annealing protein [Bacillus phage Staley]YP_008771986.1 Sak4-like ssDNA annealing protein [Bacillus phage Slash]YP_009203688.1 Sak4-like ssDNA annealing protein [Bacillus phage Stahl]AGY48373.1 hypothetical protein Slash_84 [Bacillus phage Slash]AGY48769.1 hypothetical protein Staley_86 [Bacillus phage Staley]AKA61512.1 hypothetical protein CPT_Stahl84 [Bacillus phage Stahl]